jgi:hypothetical protein
MNGNTNRQTPAAALTADRDAQCDRLLEAERRLYAAARRRGGLACRRRCGAADAARQRLKPASQFLSAWTAFKAPKIRW